MAAPFLAELFTNTPVTETSEEIEEIAPPILAALFTNIESMTTSLDVSILIAPPPSAVLLMNVESITTLLDSYTLIAPPSPKPTILVLLTKVELIKTLLAIIWTAEPLLLMKVVFNT